MYLLLNELLNIKCFSLRNDKEFFQKLNKLNIHYTLCSQVPALKLKVSR